MSLILCLTLVLLLFGCGTGENGGIGTQAFSVGYGKADISPQHSVYLRGYGDPKNERMSTGVSDPLYATCVAITDAAGNTVILISTDLLLTTASAFDPIRKSISEQTDVPVDNIMVSASHNHCAPDYNDHVYATLLRERIPQACVEAMEDRKPAQMYTTFCRPEGYAYVRHYLLIDGSYQGKSVGTVPTDNIIGHYENADNLMQLVKFTREGGKSIMMVNWQAHAHMLGNVTSLSADYPGVLRETVEKDLGHLCVFYQGASGNINPQSRIEKEQEIPTGEYRALGKKLAEYVAKAESGMTPAKTGKIQCKQQIYAATVNHSQDDLKEVAAKIVDDYNQTKNYDAALKAGEKYGIYGYMEASVIVARSKRDATLDLELSVIAIGDLSFVTLPLEMFDISGMQIKSQTPFEMTLILGHTGSVARYAAPKQACDNGGYEVYNSLVVPGTAEEMVSRYLKGLNELYNG